MSESVAARVYAEALFEVASDLGKIAAVGTELEQFGGALEETAELRTFLSTPRVRAEDKRAVLEKICKGITAETLNFLKLLVDKGRFLALSAITSHFVELADRSADRVKVETTSARPLLKKEINRITKAIKAKVGGQIVMESKVDAALLGGLVIRVGDRVLDGSVRTRLAVVHRKLVEARPESSVWEGDIDEVTDAIRKQFASTEKDTSQ